MHFLAIARIEPPRCLRWLEGTLYPPPFRSPHLICLTQCVTQYTAESHAYIQPLAVEAVPPTMTTDQFVTALQAGVLSEASGDASALFEFMSLTALHGRLVTRLSCSHHTRCRRCVHACCGSPQASRGGA
jgi:hypothetical protein